MLSSPRLNSSTWNAAYIYNLFCDNSGVAGGLAQLFLRVTVATPCHSGRSAPVVDGLLEGPFEKWFTCSLLFGTSLPEVPFKGAKKQFGIRPMSLLPFWALNVSVVLLSMQGQKALGFCQKYLNLFSEDEQSLTGLKPQEVTLKVIREFSSTTLNYIFFISKCCFTNTHI